jgi:hypothetical protein
MQAGVHFSMNPVILSTRFLTSRRSRPLSVLPFPAHMEYAAVLPPTSRLRATRTCGGTIVVEQSVYLSLAPSSVQQASSSWSMTAVIISSNMAGSEDAQGRHRRFRREISTGADGSGGETRLERTDESTILAASPSLTSLLFLS